MSLLRLSLLIGLLLNAVASISSSSNEALFPGRFIELAENNDYFYWLKQPVWAKDGSYALLAMSKWVNQESIACGMMWRYNDTTGSTRFSECSGHFESQNDRLHWAGSENDLLVCNGKTCAF